MLRTSDLMLSQTGEKKEQEGGFNKKNWEILGKTTEGEIVS